MKEPLVSAKMITYNHAPYIAQAIEGVLQQETNFPFELVIGEDCSTDGTREIVFDYQEKYPDIIRIITSSKNIGAKKNSFRTEKACRGKYIAYCEGDDYWHHPQKLQKQVDYMESHPECGLVFSDFYCYCVKRGRLIKRVRRYKGETNIIPNDPGKVLVAMFQGAISVATCTVCLRKEPLDSLVASDPFLYTSGHFPIGDTQIWVGFSQISRLHYIDESLATHNLLIESASRSRDPIKLYRFRKSGAKLCAYMAEKYRLPEAEVKCFREYFWHQSLKLAFYEMNAQSAEEIKGSKRRLSLKEWLLYWGSQSKLLNFTLRPIICLNMHIRKFFSDKHSL